LKNKNMKSFFITITVLLFITLVSCNQAKQDSGKTNQAPVPSTSQEQNTGESTDSANMADAETTEKLSTEQDNVEVMLNPPHGEPNHRCDIPVGEPLPSSPANEQKEAEVMLNPPHGEPNHRCDIRVGEPLPSTSTNAAPQTINRQVQTTAPDLANNPMAPTVENAKRLNSTQSRSTAAPATGEKPGLNPAHGQPWHRCDIAVGSPLP
jgi:hypothetical protein